MAPVWRLNLQRQSAAARDGSSSFSPGRSIFCPRTMHSSLVALTFGQAMDPIASRRTIQLSVSSTCQSTAPRCRSRQLILFSFGDLVALAMER